MGAPAGLLRDDDQAGSFVVPLHQVRRPFGLGSITDGGAACLLAPIPPRPSSHEALHRAAGDGDAFAVELGVDLPRPVDPEVGLGVTLMSSTSAASRAGAGGQASRRSRCSERSGHRRRSTCCRDLLDPKRIPVLVDVADQHRGGALLDLAVELRGDKKAALVLRISLAPGNSRASYSS